MTHWQASKYVSLIVLQKDAANNCLWRPDVANISRSGNSGTTQNKSKTPMPMTSYKRPRGSIGHNGHVSYGNFGKMLANVLLVARLLGGIKKMLKQILNPSKSHVSDKKAKCNSFVFKSEYINYDSWNKAKDKLTADEYNKRRRTNACINCGEVGYKFSDCPKLKL